MKWTFRGDRPIYAQLVEQFRVAIASGEYPAGSGISSVRTLAIEAQVNPNTMQRALTELENQGLLITHRTSGRTVTDDIGRLDALKEELAGQLVKDFLTNVAALGISPGQAIELLKKEGGEQDGSDMAGN